MNSERVLDGPRMPNPLHWDRELSLTQEALAASRPLPISHHTHHIRRSTSPDRNGASGFRAIRQSARRVGLVSLLRIDRKSVV